jgi:hypothetical protein
MESIITVIFSTHLSAVWQAVFARKNGGSTTIPCGGTIMQGEPLSVILTEDLDDSFNVLIEAENCTMPDSYVSMMDNGTETSMTVSSCDGQRSINVSTVVTCSKPGPVTLRAGWMKNDTDEAYMSPDCKYIVAAGAWKYLLETLTKII